MATTADVDLADEKIFCLPGRTSDRVVVVTDGRAGRMVRSAFSDGDAFFGELINSRAGPCELATSVARAVILLPLLLTTLPATALILPGDNAPIAGEGRDMEGGDQPKTCLLDARIELMGVLLETTTVLSTEGLRVFFNDDLLFQFEGCLPDEGGDFLVLFEA